MVSDLRVRWDCRWVQVCIVVSKKYNIQYSDHNRIMKGDGKEDRGFPIGKYKIRAELGSSVAESRKVKEFIYYFTYCEAKKGKDSSGSYDAGYFCIIHHISTNRLTLFFKKRKIIADMNSQQNEMINLQGYTFSHLRQVVGNKFHIQYQIGDNSFDLQVKLKSEEVANRWREFISIYKPQVVYTSKNAKNTSFDEQKQSDALLSTKDSKNSVEDKRKLAKILDYRASTEKMDHKKCQFCLKDVDSLQLQYKISKLQELVNIQANKAKEMSIQLQLSKRKFQEQYEALLQEKRTVQSMLKSSQAELRLKQESKTNLQTELFLKQNSQLKSNVSILQDKNKSLQGKLHQLQRYIEEAQRNIRLNQQQKKTLNIKIKESLKENQQSHQKIREMTKKFQQKCSQHEYDKQILKKANQSLLLQNESLKKEVKALQAKIAAQKSAVDHAQRIQKIKQDYQTQQKQLKLSYNKRLAQETKKCQFLEQEVTKWKAQSEQSSRLIKSLIFNGVFNGGILDNFDAYKEYLINEIQSYMNRSIFKTKLIYRFEPLNKVNFHNYIDGCSNLVVIARTSSGYYLAAFTESPFYPKATANDAGLLFSLTNCSTFRCLQGKRSITYDEYYIIFGNSQFRIKSLQNRIFSNFGISNGFYNSNGQNVDTLFGENQREVDLDAYEIYQVHFS